MPKKKEISFIHVGINLYICWNQLRQQLIIRLANYWPVDRIDTYICPNAPTNKFTIDLNVGIVDTIVDFAFD